MPSTSALFASSAGRSQSKNLVEFKAGKMNMKGNMVHPDKRKGLLYVYQSDDYLIHFCWKDRSSGSVEDDLIIFPDDSEFKRVEACTTGRVYVLKFKASNRKFFFWLQEPKTDKDEENCKKVNEMLNNPPTVGSSRSGGGTPDDLHNLLGSMSQQQLMQLFGSFGSGSSGSSPGSNSLSSILNAMNRPGSSSRTSTTTSTTSSSSPATTETTARDGSATTTTTTTSSGATSGTNVATSAGAEPAQGAIRLSDLQQFLSTINTSGAATAGITTPASAETTIEVDLSDALMNAESIQGILNNPTLVAELSPHLPETPLNLGQDNSDRLRDTLSSPQFQQAVRRFGAALNTGQIGPVVEQFQVGEGAVLAATQGNMEQFVKALEKTNINPQDDKKSGEGTSSAKKKEDEKDKKDEDEKMQED